VGIWCGKKARQMAELLLIQLLLHFAWLFETIVLAAEQEAAVLTQLPQEPGMYLPHMAKMPPPKLKKFEES
jgi:hypothetical protein